MWDEQIGDDGCKGGQNYCARYRRGTLIGGVGAFVSALIQKGHETESAVKAQDVSVGRDIVAGGNVSVTVNHYAYLEKEKTPQGFVPPDFGADVPDSILASQKEPLLVYPTGSGLFEPSVDFIVHSSATANVIVERLYLKVKAYAECEIREARHKGTLGDAPDTNLALFVNENFDVYPLKPMSGDLRKSSWTYKGTDSNGFSIRFYGPPYVLYFYTIDIDYFDLSTNQKRHTETTELSALVGQQIKFSVVDDARPSGRKRPNFHIERSDWMGLGRNFRNVAVRLA